MQIIITRRKSKRHKQQIVVLPDSPSMGSLAEYFLLKQSLCFQDPERLFIDPESHQALRKTTLRKKQRKFNARFLRNELVIQGELHCCFCGKKDLKIEYEKQHEFTASADHFFPKSEGGAAFDEDNLVVSCIKCNHKKQSDFRYISDLVKMRKNKLVRLRKYARENGFGLWVRPQSILIQAEMELVA